MATPSPDPETVQWVYDYIPHYRLNPTIITEYLKTKWPDYDEFLVEASCTHVATPFLCFAQLRASCRG